MTILALLLLLLAAAVPLLDRPLRRWLDDPVLPVAALTTGLLAAAALAAASTDDVGTASAGWSRAAAAVLGVLVAVSAGSHVVRGAFRLTRGEIRPLRADGAGPAAADPAADPPVADPTPLRLEAPGSVLRGGAWIGYLERGATAAAVLAGFPEGVALVLAVKGVGRYPELRDSGRGADAPEEFIIGTLTSLLWAVAAAGAATGLR